MDQDLEKAYKQILKIKLEALGLNVKEEIPVDIVVDGITIKNVYFIDLLINDSIILELKAVQELKPVHHKQLITYMRLANKETGLLINFCCNDMYKEGLRSWNLESVKKI